MSARTHHGRHGHGRLFWRVYLNGLLLLGLVAVAVVAAGALIGPHGPPMRPERIVEFAAAQTADAFHDPERLRAILRRAHDAFGIEMAVFDGDRLVAANVEPPPAPLHDAERARLAAGSAFRIPGPSWAYAAPLRGLPGAYAVLTGGWRPYQLTRIAAVVGAILLALAIASVPLARGIAAPIERLAAAARRLGEGDLTARAGLGGRGEVGDLGRAFDEMAGRLERLVRAERELLANVSHELRTPLARIRVALELAAEGDQARARRYLREIGTDLGELERMVADVLSAARLDQGAGQRGCGPSRWTSRGCWPRRRRASASGVRHGSWSCAAAHPWSGSTPTRPCCAGPSTTCSTTPPSTPPTTRRWSSRPGPKGARSWSRSATTGSGSIRPTCRASSPRSSGPIGAGPGAPAASGWAWRW